MTPNLNYTILSIEVEKSYGNGYGSFPTRNFSTKENERHSPHPWSKHDAPPVWSDKGLISYDRLLQLRQYRTPINSPAINSLHWTPFLSVCSCLTSIRAPSPACKSWWASEDGSVGWNGDERLAVQAGGRRSPSGAEQLSCALQVSTVILYLTFNLKP